MKVLVKTEGTNTEVRCHGTDSLLSVTAMDIQLRPGAEPVAEAFLAVGRAVLQAEAAFYVQDPETGLAREVKAIEWADGGRTEL